MIIVRKKNEVGRSYRMSNGDGVIFHVKPEVRKQPCEDPQEKNKNKTKQRTK